VSSVHAPSWADFITATPAFKLSVHTPDKQTKLDLQSHLADWGQTKTGLTCAHVNPSASVAGNCDPLPAKTQSANLRHGRIGIYANQIESMRIKKHLWNSSSGDESVRHYNNNRV
jgi:hypothetical protein